MQGIHVQMHADIDKKKEKKKETMWGGGGCHTPDARTCTSFNCE